MREIKFRTFVKDNKKMIYNNYSAMAVKMFTPNYAYLDSEVEVMQYTGLKDKNGIEIYEGDILDTHAQFDDIYIRKVVYKDCGLTLEPGTGFTLCKNNEENFEIIGNIYENLELVNTRIEERFQTNF